MRLFVLSVTALLLSITTFAQGFDIAVGEPLRSQREVLKVKGRTGMLIKQKMSFGNYRTTMVQRSGIRKWYGYTGFPGLIWTEQMDGKQSIHFRLASATDTSDVVAVTNVANTDLLLGATDDFTRLPGSIVSLFKKTELSQNNFSVAIVTKNGEQPWELFLDNSEAQIRRKQAAGYVTRGDEYYTIQPVWQLETKSGKIGNMPFGSAGFELVDKEGRVMAGVSLMDKGNVYLGPGTEEQRFLFANVCAALLLQSNIN